MSIKLDEKTIRNLPYEKKQKYYFDSKQTGFGICVGQKTKTFFIQRYRNDKLIRVKIGNHGDINCTTAREKAQEYAIQIQQGINPNEEKRKQRENNTITIQHLYDNYADSLLAQGKHSSYENYPKELQRHLSDWMNKSAFSITRDMVIKRHQRITQSSGPSAANRACVILSGIYQHAIAGQLKIENPVKVLTDCKLWNKPNQRSVYLKPKQFKIWLSALEQKPSEIIRLFILFVLLNGLRKSEGLTLAWEHIDFDHNTFTIPKTKNGKSLTLPITEFTRPILDYLYKHRINEWVFPSEKSASGHLQEPKRVIEQLKKSTGLDINLHDLRRSLACVANGLGITGYTIKPILNHSTANDVTAIYIPGDIESLRNPLQKIQHQILHLGETDITRFLKPSF